MEKLKIKTTDFTTITLENTLKVLNQMIKIQDYVNRLPEKYLPKQKPEFKKALRTGNWDED